MDGFIPYCDNARLFIAELSTDSVGQLLLVLPQDAAEQTISLQQAWPSEELLGSFAYAAAGFDVTPQTADEFVAAVLAKVESAGAERGFLWAQAGVEDAAVLGLSPTADAVSKRLELTIATGLTFVIEEPASLNLTGSTVLQPGAGRMPLLRLRNLELAIADIG